MQTLLEKGMVDCDDCNRKDHSLYIFVVITSSMLPAQFVLYLDENQPSFLFPTVTCQVTPPDAWHVDPSPGPRHLARTPTRRPRALYFLRHKLSTRSRQLQRFQNPGKRRRFDPANGLGDIDGFGCSISQPP